MCLVLSVVLAIDNVFHIASVFSRDYTVRQKQVGVGDCDITHPHGVRVRSYNDVSGTLGRPLAGAHGGWVQPEDKATSSVGNSRYDRFPLSLVIRIAACIAGTDLGDFVLSVPSEDAGSLHVPAGEIRERAVAKPVAMQREAPLRVSASEVQGLATSPGSDSDEEDVDKVPVAHTGLPPGWSKEQRVAPTRRKYWRFQGPLGSGSRILFSLAAAWGEFDALRESGAEVEWDSDEFDVDESSGFRDIGDADPANGLRADESFEQSSILEFVAPVQSTISEPVAPKQFFELVRGLCGTPMCGLEDNHLGLCVNQVVARRRQDVATRSLMSPEKHVGSQVV